MISEGVLPVEWIASTMLDCILFGIEKRSPIRLFCFPGQLCPSFSSPVICLLHWGVIADFYLVALTFQQSLKVLDLQQLAVSTGCQPYCSESNNTPRISSNSCSRLDGWECVCELRRASFYTVLHAFMISEVAGVNSWSLVSWRPPLQSDKAWCKCLAAARIWISVEKSKVHCTLHSMARILWME